MSTLSLILITTFLISLASLLGFLPFIFQFKKFENTLLLFVSLSAGALMGGAFLHLLPQAVVTLGPQTPFFIVLIAFVFFFLVEKFFHWHHCHRYNCHQHTLGYMNLFSDAIHNFIDGLIIAAAFSFNHSLGLVTVLAVALHEIPQEIGDFSVLLYAGWTRKKALIANFFTALTIILGALVGYFFTQIHAFTFFLMSFAAGGFIYISASDLVPEIKKETKIKKSFLLFVTFTLGILLMLILKFIDPS